MIHEIWIEGFLITGSEGTPTRASFVGKSEGNTFREAVLNWHKNHPDASSFNPQTLSYWGCQLYPTEGEARRSFG